MAHYAIIGIKKLHTAGNIAGSLEHMTRQRPTPNSNGRPNDILIPPPPLPELMEEINSYMPRKNCVICYEMLLTMSSGWLQGKGEKDIQEWEQKSLEWVSKKFPPGAVKSCICHRDELVPHLTLLVLPLAPPDGENQRLCARHYTGGRAKMRQLWTEYAAAMKPLGLERGREYSPAKHTSIKEYYARVNNAERRDAATKVLPEQLPAPAIADRANPRAYAAELINYAVEWYRKENAALREELAAEKGKTEGITRQVIADRELYFSLKENPDAYRELEKALLQERKGRAADKRKYNQLIGAVKEFFRRNIDPRSPYRKAERLGELMAFRELAGAIGLDLKQQPQQRQGMTLERT